MARSPQIFGVWFSVYWKLVFSILVVWGTYLPHLLMIEMFTFWSTLDLWLAQSDSEPQTYEYRAWFRCVEYLAQVFSFNDNLTLSMWIYLGKINFRYVDKIKRWCWLHCQITCVSLFFFFFFFLYFFFFWKTMENWDDTNRVVISNWRVDGLVGSSSFLKATLQLPWNIEVLDDFSTVRILRFRLTWELGIYYF